MRIEAQSVDLTRKSESHELDTSLKPEQECKSNPRLLIYGVLNKMSQDELRSKIIALNLKDVISDLSDAKIVNIFPSKENRRSINCVIKVLPNIRIIY